MDDQRLRPRVRTRDVRIGLRTSVCVGIDPQPEEAQVPDRCLPNSRRVLADSAREDEDVQSSERRRHGGDACT